MEFDKLDVQFLASIAANPRAITELEKEVTTADFDDVLYFQVYDSIVEFLIGNKKPSYGDLKLKFRTDEIVQQLLGEMEKAEIVFDISQLHSEMVERSNLKKLRSLSKELSFTLSKNSTSNDVLDLIDSELLKIRVGSGIVLRDTIGINRTFQEDLSEKVKRYKQYNGVAGVVDLPTSIISLDLFTLGIERKSTWVLGGGTSDGKTQLAIQMCNAVINSGKQVLYFMLEDTEQKLFYRLLSLRTGIPIKDIIVGNLTNEQYNKIQEEADKLAALNRLFVEETINDINDIVTISKFAKLKHPNIGVIVLDHINLIADKYRKSNSNREQEIGGSSKKLVALAKECDIGVLILQQLNTNPDERSRGLPVTTNDLRDCKSTSHDSAVTILLNCPDKYKDDSVLKFSKKHTQIIVAKNRYGEVNQIIDLTSMAHIAKFVEGIPTIKQKKGSV